jgi:5-oxoprolinase (ATP-hydrolysing) subunit A
MSPDQMRKAIDLNCDMGESFARYSLGADEEMMKFITSANIACGWHAGDPGVMRATVSLAVQHDVGVGAHVSFPDPLGWGLRSMSVSPEELYDYVVYQAGALAGFVHAAGNRLRHLKPHGSMYAVVAADADLADALMRAVRDTGPDVAVLLTGEICREAAAAVGVPYVEEGFIDIPYDAGGGLVFASTASEWAQTDADPDLVADRAVRICLHGTVDTIEGGTLALAPRTLCLHGDLPRAAARANRVRERLAEEGVDVVRFEVARPGSATSTAPVTGVHR